MQRLRPDISSGTSSQPTLTVAISESDRVQILALTATSCTTNKSLVYNTIVLVSYFFKPAMPKSRREFIPLGVLRGFRMSRQTPWAIT